MRGVINDQCAERLSRAASEQFIAQIRREKEEAKGSLAALLSKSGASSLRDYIQHDDSTHREEHSDDRGSMLQG